MTKVGAHVSQFGEETVRKVAELARLRLNDQEVAKFTEQLGNVLGYIEKLAQLDTSKVEPLTHPLELATPMRADEAVASPGAETILSAAPEHLHDSFKVPQVLGGPS